MPAAAQPTRLSPAPLSNLEQPLVIEKSWTLIHDFCKEPKEDYKHRQFVVEYPGSGYFDMNIGWTLNDKDGKPNLQKVQQPSSYTWVVGCDGQPYSVHMLKQVVLPEGKKSLVENILRQSLIKMLQLAPENPAFRAQVLAIVLIPIPDEATTWKEIKDWIESNIDQTKVVRPQKES